MDELVRWLGEQLDEDERIARAAGEEDGPDWHYDGHAVLTRRENDLVAVGSQDFMEPARGEHIAAHDPARVLREIDAKRQLLDDHPIVPRTVEPTSVGGQEIGGPYYPFGCGNCHADPETGEVSGFGYCLTWRVLAAVHADRSGYRQEWSP